MDNDASRQATHQRTTNRFGVIERCAYPDPCKSLAAQELLAGIRSLQKEIIVDNDASRQATRRQDIATIRDRMQSNVNHVSREALSIKKRLEQLEADNVAAQRQPVSYNAVCSTFIDES